jgi:putative transposase
MIKGYKIKIFPNEEQQKKIIRFCSASRYIYNWALSLEIENYKQGNKFIDGYSLTRMLTQFKKQEGNEWLKEISGRALKISVMNCAKAYENFFKKFTKYPKFKSKKRSKISCATHERSTLIENKRIRLEKIGWVKCGYHNIPNGDNRKLINPKISYDGIDFWVSMSINTIDNEYNNKPKTEVIGIDVGIKTLATCSNGMVNVKPNIKKEKKKLKRLQRKASRDYQKMIDKCKETKTKFQYLTKSKNLLKLEREIIKQYKRIQNILNNNIHNFTTSLIKLNPQTIVIEDLNVKGMMKNKHLSEKLMEAKFYEIRRQLEYKCKWNNIKLIIADRWYASSKICSECGNKKVKLSLSERTYVCKECGCVLDRDLNASFNLRNLAYAT